jgi:hypothetical protein
MRSPGKRDQSWAEVDRVFTKRLNRGMNNEIPREIKWVANASSHFPVKNNHNVPYYKTGQVLENAGELEAFAQRLERQLPYLPDKDRARLIFTKSGRCSKCNCMFNGKGGQVLRMACVVKCLCGQTELEAYCCVQCRVLQWILQGCCIQPTGQLYDAETRVHQGFARCPKKTCPCDTQTLDDFYKVHVPVKNSEEPCN